ncbi:MAG: MFS transporter [Bacteroidetes bacterium]|nr:MFS transporter [Bacteroidota bacterium]
MHPNIYRLYLIKIAKWFMLYMPIVVPFYESNGLSMKDIMVLQAIYSIAIVILEIPSGYLADVIGRRKTLILGAVFGTFGFATYSFSYGFMGFLIAEIILGIGQSCISGADSAMLYDSLLERGEEKKYSRYEGRIISLGNIAEAVAGIIGGLLAGITLRAPYIAQAFVAFIALPAAITLVEPSRKIPLIKAGIMEIIQIARFALFENRLLRRNILFSAIIGTSTLTMAWFAQPFFEFAGIEIKWYGLLWTTLNLTVAITSYTAHRLESKLGQRWSILIIAITIPLGYLALGRFHLSTGLIILYLFYLVRGYATPVLKDYINRVTESHIRATVLSVRNFIIRLLFAFTGPLLGWIKDLYSLPQALTLAGAIFLVLSILTAILFLSTGKEMNRITTYKSRTRPS